MKKNMGSTDKIIRIVLAITFGFLYFTNIVSGTFGVVLMLLAVVFLLTSFISFCPLYAVFKLKTNKETAQ